jgi:NADPH2:quinone reductase
VNSEAIFLVRKGPAKQAFEKQKISLPTLKDHEVLIESEAFGLNYADVMARNGLYREAPPMPCVIGYEVVGRIIEVGAKGDSKLVGQRVLAFCRFGGYGRHVITTQLAVLQIGDLPSAEVLALSTQGVTAYYMSDYLAPIQKGDRVLIHAAAGGVGTMLIQLAKLKGAEVIAKVGSSQKEQLAKEMGADYTINYKARDYYESLKDTPKIDVSYNPFGGSTFKKDFKLLRPGGKLFLFGGSELSGGKFGFISSLNFLRKMGVLIPAVLMMSSKSILGVNMLKVGDYHPQVMNDCMAAVLQLYKNKEIKAVVGKVYPVDQIAFAHEYLESGNSTGKISILWD